MNLRRGWAVITSMRTALILLLFLALAATPGAMFPQRNLNPEKVQQYYADHPSLAPMVDRLWGFDVFAAPWFAAIYLLLFVSLLGCLATRIPVYLRSLVKGPPAAPRRLDKLPHHESLGRRAGSPTELSSLTVDVLRKRGWRRVTTRTTDDGVTVSAERGYLRETGNLVFHLSLVAVLIGIAIGALFSWRGGMLIVEGATTCNSVQSYDQFTPGRLVKATALPPFCVTLDDFRARFSDGGQPLAYNADIRYVHGDDATSKQPDKPFQLAVNKPLRMDGAGFFLINHGYAPILRYTDRHGTVFESPTPFLPQDRRLTSEGVVMLPDANQDPTANERIPNVQMAFEGIYVPTEPAAGPKVRSAGPAREAEGITLLAYRGDTGLNTGIPRSVYTLDEQQIEKKALQPIGSKFLRVGEVWPLDDGTTVEFVGTEEWMSVNVAHDPGQRIVLGGAAGMVAGLLVSLFVRRRRFFLRLHTADGPGTTIDAGGLARTGSDSYTTEFRRLVAALEKKLPALADNADNAREPVRTKE